MTCALPMTPLSLSAAFAAGAASSLHCLGMCGGIAGALALRARQHSARRSTIALHTVGHQAGRIAGYGILGGLGGALKKNLSASLGAWHVAYLFRSAAPLVVITLGLQLILGRVPLRTFERGGARVWQWLAPLTRRVTRNGSSGTLLIGMTWALMPCGLVYSMLSIATLSASPVTGSALMVLFGAGTLPAVLGGSLLLSCARTGFLVRQVPARAAGALLLTFGIWTAYSTLP